MFHIIESYPLKLYKAQSSRILFLLPIGRTQVASITEDCILILYSLSTKTMLKQILLPDKPRKAITITESSIGILIPGKQAILEVHLNKGKIEEIQVIHKFQAITHQLLPRNPHKEKQYFSTMVMQPFLLSQSFHIQEYNPEGRKCCIRIFKKQYNEWKTTAKELGISFERVCKLNETSKLVIFNPNIESHRQFKFRTYDTLNEHQDLVTLQSESFVDYSVVVGVKEYKESWFVQVNKKNPEIICFRRGQECQGTELKTTAIWIISLGSMLFNLCYSEKAGIFTKLQMRNGIKLLDEVQGKFNNSSISKEGLLVDFEKEKSETEATKIETYRSIRKDKLYLNLLTKTFKKAKESGNIFNQVLSLLAQ